MKGQSTVISAVALTACVLLALPGTASAVSVGFKFFGGYNSMNGGDINEGLKGWVDLYKAEAALGGAISNGDYKAFHAGWDAGGDLIIFFTPIIGIGFGGSFLQAQSSSEITFTIPIGTATIKVKPQVTAIPIRAGLHFAVPMGSFVNLTLNAGAEYYLARVKYSLRFDVLGDWRQEEVNVDSKGKFGFCGGIGLEVKIHPNLSILLEGRGRYARLDGFEGSENDTYSSGPPDHENGKLWYAEIIPAPGYRFPILGLSDTAPPPDPSIPLSRLARLDINGFSALAGIMFRF